MRILYLEDNPNDAELTLRVFKSHDPRAKLITAGDVHTALGIIQSHPADYFDIFLSDFELPDGDAIQFLEAIHQRGLFQPVVVVTGNDDPQVRNRTLAQGIAGFLYKEGKYLETLPEKIEKIHKSYRENRKRQSVIRVLYAEHNPVDAELTQLHFASHAAHIVLQVISSATELERTCQPGGKNPEYDVIVLDTDIQRQGDLSLLQKLKAEWKIEQPVILLTAPGEDRLTVQALQMGAENSVIKNIGYFQLLPAIIEVAFTKSRLMKEQKISLERERLFRLMTENARDIVFRLRFSPDFGFDYISAAVKRLTGYSPEEFYENPSLLMELVDPEDFSRLQQMLAKPTRFGKPILLRWHTRDGRLLWVEAKGSFVHDSTGKFVALEGIARDITERIRFESALQAENERRQELETIINKSPVIVVRWKPKVRQPLDYISANISSLGYKAKDFLDGKILYEDIVHPDDVKKLESEVSQHAQANDMQYRMRYRLITKKGETHWIDDLTWVVKDDQGTPLYHQGIVTDITSRMQVEQALEQAESQYHQLVDQIPAVTYVDRNDEVATNLFTSPQIESVVGYTPQEWMEDPGLRFRTIHPDDLERVKAEHERTNLTGKPFHMEYRLIHKDGRVVWVDDRSALLRGPEGEPDRWQGVLVDITERKAREEELHKSLELFDLALKGADLGFWDWDIPVGKFYFSPRCAEMFEYQPQEIEPTVKNWDSMTHPDDLQREYKAIDEHFQGISPSFEIDLRVRTKPGEYKWAQIRGKVIERKKDGTPLRAAGTLRDITSQKKIEEEEQRRIKRNQDERQSIIQLALDPAVSSGDFDVAIQHLTENVAKVLGVERASVWMYTEGEDGILCTDLYERSKKRHSKGLILQARDYPTYFESLRAGRAIAAQDALSDPRTFEFSEGYLQPLGITSLLDSAIRVRSQMVGVVCFEHIGEPRHWHQDEITYGGEIADQVAQVILNLERHTAEEATRSNEVKFRTIIEQSAEGFVLLDEDGFVIDWNRTTEKLFEIARKDAIGHYFWDLLYRVLIPERRTGERYNSLKKAIQAALKRDQSPLFQKPIEAEIVNLKGEHVFIQQTIFPLFISGQRFLGSFIQDITDRKNAEQGVRESEARFKALFEQANDAIFLMDGDRFIDCNKRTEMIFGAKREEIIGKKPFDFSPLHQPDGEKSIIAGTNHIHAAFSGTPQVFEWVQQRKDGTPFDADVNLKKVEIGGKPFLHAMVRDISDRKRAEKAIRESENRFRSIFEQANDAIFILDENKLVDCNHQTELLFDWKRNEFLGKSPPELSPETQPDGRDSDEAGEEKFELALQGTPQRFEWVHLRKNGTLFDVEASLNRIEIGGKAMVQAIIRDITERKLADLSLNAAEKRYRGLFEDSPISLWEEDFSEVKEYLDSLKKRGVKDFHRYLHKHPGTIQKCLNLVKVIDVNRATLKLYEAAQKDDLLKNLDRVMTEESNRWFVKEIEEIAEGKTEFRWEGLNRTLSGKDILVDLRWAAAPGFEEILSKVIISIEDITEKKKAEVKLRQSEEKYRELFERMESAVAVYQAVEDGNDFEFLDFNRRAEEIEGLKRKQVLGKRVTKVFPGAAEFGILEIFKRVWQTGQAEFYPAAIYRDEKRRETWRENWIYRLPDGKIVAIYADVTQRQRTEEAIRISEARYRSLVENQIAVISRTNLDGKLTFVNDEFCRVFGRKKEELLGNRIVSPVLPEDQHLVGQAIQKAMKPPYHSQLENRNITAKGIRWFRWENSTILDSQGNISELQYVGWDITEQKNAQMALQRRDEIMEAVSFTATRLLVAADWKKQAPIILEKLGRAAHVDRVYLLEYPNIHHGISLSEITDNLIEWVAPGTEHRLQDVSLPGLSDFSQAMNRWKTTLTRGEMIVAAPGKIPKNEQSFLDVLGIKGMVLVPILLEGTLWGLLGFDQVTEDHPWDETEMEALKTFADTFASAIQRNKAYEDLLDRETRLHAILEASKDAILVSIHDATVYANTAFRKLFGLSLQDDLEDTSIDSLIAPTDRKRYREISQDRQNGKPAPTHYELKALKKNSAEFDLEIHVSTYELMGETYTLALLRDITEKKQHDRELEALSTVSTALRKARSREEMYPIIVDQLIEVMQANGGLISLEEPVSEEMVLNYGSGEFAGQEGLHIPKGKGISGEVKRTKKPYISHDLLSDPMFFHGPNLTHCKEAVAYPMIVQKKVIGVMLVSRQQPFDKSEIRVIGSIAEIAANAIQRSALHEQTENRLQKLIALRQIDNAISSTLDVHQIIDTILTSSQKFLKVDAADILLYDEESRKLNFAYGVGFRTNLLKGFSLKSGEGWAGEAFRKRKPMMVPDINQVSDKQINPAPPVEELVSYYVIPLITSNQVKGVMECFTRSPLRLDQDWEEFINLLAGQAAIAINSAQLFDEIKHSNLQLVRAYDDTIEGWSRAMDIRDKETEGHTLRVVDLTLRLARAMGVPEDQLTHIKRGTLLHDIGKLVVPDSILFKPSSLTDLEWKIMKKHPLNAYNMLVSVDYLKPALDIPYCHHEHWDGSGYPRGLKGEDIPLAARIFSVVDIWDALLSDRPYRPAWTREKTLAYIKSRTGEDLDPKVVKVFLKIISESK